MSAAVLESAAWPRRRWWLVAGLIGLLQTALICWLLDRGPIVPSSTASASVTFFEPNQTSELSSLADPTLFALANRHGFSGKAWFKLTSLRKDALEWTESPRFLEPEPSQLGAVLEQFVQTDLALSVEIAIKPATKLEIDDFYPLSNALSAKSTVQVKDALAGRPLIFPLELPSIQSVDILTNSEVLVAVDQDGKVNSAILNPRSHSPEADSIALKLAKSARFRPVRDSGLDSMSRSTNIFDWGRLVFHWHTTPPLGTNPPAGSP